MNIPDGYYEISPGIFERRKKKVNNPNTRKNTQLEPNPIDAPLAAEKLQGAVQKRYLVRIESVRKYMLDTDNVCSKYLTDLLRYSGCIDADDFEQTSIQTTERKCGTGEDEHTLVTIDQYENKT